MDHSIRGAANALGGTDRARRFGHRYRLDDVPVVWMPAFLLYGYVAGALVYTYTALVHLSSTIEHQGQEPLSNANPHIFCIWHQFSWPYVAAFRAHRHHVWLLHPYWYMKPVQVALRWSGVRSMILGSTGNLGRQAADRLVEELRAGASTGLAPDGPEGPARQPKKGIIHVAAQSGLPIIPLRIHCSRSFKLRGWDKKVIPLPFGTIIVRHGRPIRVARYSEEARAALAADL